MAFIAPAFATLSAAAGGMTATQMVALGMTAASGIVGARGAMAQGKMEDQLAEQEARYNDLRATDEIARGVQDQDKIRIQLRRILGSQRASYGASGVDTNQGTPLNVALDSGREAELDMLTIANNASRAAFGFKESARRSRISGKFSKKAGKYNAWGTALTTGANAYGIYEMNA